MSLKDERGSVSRVICIFSCDKRSGSLPYFVPTIVCVLLSTPNTSQAEALPLRLASLDKAEKIFPNCASRIIFSSRFEFNDFVLPVHNQLAKQCFQLSLITHLQLTGPAACTWPRWRPSRAPTRRGSRCTTRWWPSARTRSRCAWASSRARSAAWWSRWRSGGRGPDGP